ncbi:hypothetical protein Mpsy_2394 [Methanolobus psychrophilus R15]|nr:hypothetical protein Mpsy_2394 [Methanolobus psychrophilus R15]
MIMNNNENKTQIPRTSSSPKLTGKEKDCIVKGIILRGLLEKQPMRSRELFNSIPYDNYDSFRVILSRFSSSKYRYIEKIGHKMPYLYRLTDIGRVHAQNPFYFRDKYRARQAKDREIYLSELLNDPSKLNYFFGNVASSEIKTIFNTVKEYVDSNSSMRDFGDEDDSHQSADDEENDFEEKYYTLQEEIKQLKTQNFNLQLKLNQKPAPIPKAPETKLPSASKGKRYDYLCSWDGKVLTSSFFESELIPYDVLIKTADKNTISSWKKKLNLESDENIDIFARNISSTLIKERLYRKASPEEIKEAGFYLVRNRGIRILSKKYSTINKVVLKQSDIPASPRNTPQANIVDKNRR